MCTNVCCALEAWSEGMNFSMKSASILVKVQSSSLVFSLAHFIQPAFGEGLAATYVHLVEEC